MAIKVIIADDHRLFRIGVKTILAPFKNIKIIAEASNGEELIDLVRAHSPDVVLLDLRMPVMNGFEAMEHISKKYKHTKVIVISGYNDESHIVHAIECGAAAYLDKNAEPEEIEKAIQKVVNEDFYFNERINRAMMQRLSKRRVKKPVFDGNIVFSESELGVLKLLCEELTSAEISAKLYLSKRTIEGIRLNLLQKTSAKNIVGLIKFAIKHGLIDLTTPII